MLFRKVARRQGLRLIFDCRRGGLLGLGDGAAVLRGKVVEPYGLVFPKEGLVQTT